MKNTQYTVHSNYTCNPTGIKLRESTTPESSTDQQFLRLAAHLYSDRKDHYIFKYRTEIWQRYISPAISHELYFETLLRPTHISRKEHISPCLLSFCLIYD